jgi:lipopolysaccharide biosynthesis glycosyltransferase
MKRGNQLYCPISDAPMSTEFANSRFIIPFIKQKGWALFVDCDIVCLTDIKELFALADEKYAVMVVKHNHVPTEATHDAGMIQTKYARKNWSSVVLWNLDHPAHKRFTVENLNTWPGRDLHAFKWLKDEEIGELPLEWNYLVDVSPAEKMPSAKILHYTNGQPGWETWEPKESDAAFNEEMKTWLAHKGTYYNEHLARVEKASAKS